MSDPVNWSERWPSFAMEEVFSPAQLASVKANPSTFPYSFRALDKLQEFRNFVAVPLQINFAGHNRRGARSLKDVYDLNLSARGVDKWAYSFHLWCAFDISSPKMTPSELYAKAMEFKKWGGVGVYDTWVHVDDRDTLSGKVATWDFRSKRP